MCNRILMYAYNIEMLGGFCDSKLWFVTAGFAEIKWGIEKKT